ncbi:hypothetical protein PV327_006995 [Microctonus hyperodae]|uniref:Uncharacterized protein n=1 Tax=Microctonus hyperodae TaxID=165561 RepID=A0AA39KIY9_MICHY|nr:hypothetical protein PV327_006995 [Microctonus hyperodae]
MENPDNKEAISTSSNIVAIAHCQSKLMAGGEECKNSTNDKLQKNFECINRIKNSSLIVEISSTVSEAYDSLKASHNTAESILNTTENQLNEVVGILSPVTNKIGDILDDESLKSIDNAICDGFDYLCEKVPQLKSGSEKIYENIGEYLKTASNSAIVYSSSIATEIKEKLKNDKDE